MRMAAKLQQAIFILCPFIKNTFYSNSSVSSKLLLYFKLDANMQQHVHKTEDMLLHTNTFFHINIKQLVSK